MSPRLDFLPTASVANLRDRARLLGAVRQFFKNLDVLEVSTPLLAFHGVTDPHIESLSVNRLGETYYLQSSPEFAMKRVLATGIGAIYQICPAFRGGESGTRHNPEFTMLEWYRPGFSVDELMNEFGDLFQIVNELFNKPIEKIRTVSYASLFEDRFGINPHKSTIDELKQLASEQFPELTLHLTHDVEDAGLIDDLLDVLFSQGIEPTLITPHFVVGFPATQAALAKVRLVGNDLVADRFEFYWQGFELANGYNELTDADELKTRILRDNQIRQKRNLPVMAADEQLLLAMGKMPECAGIAVGVDRLLMLLSGKSSIKEVLSFPL